MIWRNLCLLNLVMLISITISRVSFRKNKAQFLINAWARCSLRRCPHLVAVRSQRSDASLQKTLRTVLLSPVVSPFHRPQPKSSVRPSHISINLPRRRRARCREAVGRFSCGWERWWSSLAMATCREAARCPPGGESSTGIQLAGGVVAVNRRKLTYPQLHRAGRPRKGWTGSSFGWWRSIGGGGATSAAQVRLNQQVMATATSAAHRWGLRVPRRRARAYLRGAPSTMPARIARARRTTICTHNKMPPVAATSWTGGHTFSASTSTTHHADPPPPRRTTPTRLHHDASSSGAGRDAATSASRPPRSPNRKMSTGTASPSWTSILCSLLSSSIQVQSFFPRYPRILSIFGVELEEQLSSRCKNGSFLPILPSFCSMCTSYHFFTSRLMKISRCFCSQF
jgi:hypothetical protein